MKMSKKCVALMVALAVCAGGSAMAKDQDPLDSSGNTVYGDISYYSTYNSVVIGNNQVMAESGNYSVLVGTQGSYLNGSYSTVLGVGDMATADNATAVGYNNAARKQGSTAIGYENEAVGKNSTAIGYNSITTGENSTALGYSAYAGAKNSTAIGNEAVNTEAGTVSFGHKAGDFAGYYYSGVDENGTPLNKTTTAYEDYTKATYTTDSFSRLTNVADGTDDNDAATYGQLSDETENRENADQTLQDNIDNEAATRLAGDNYLNTRIDQVERDANKGIAKATALAALHPLDYDPSNKFDIAAAGGFYKGENAFALGAFYRPNRDVMFSLASTVSGGDNAYNVGVSFKVGKSSKVEKPAANTAELYQMIGAMQEQLAAQQRRIEELEANQAK